jgi:hypothetical protein
VKQLVIGRNKMCIDSDDNNTKLNVTFDIFVECNPMTHRFHFIIINNDCCDAECADGTKGRKTIVSVDADPSANQQLAEKGVPMSISSNSYITCGSTRLRLVLRADSPAPAVFASSLLSDGNEDVEMNEEMAAAVAESKQTAADTARLAIGHYTVEQQTQRLMPHHLLTSRGDGNCMFHAVINSIRASTSNQGVKIMHGDVEIKDHAALRQALCDQITLESISFHDLIDECRFNKDEVDAAVVLLRNDRNWKIPIGAIGVDLGDFVIVLIAHFFNIRIAHFLSGVGSKRTVANPNGRGDFTLIQSQSGGSHWDAVVSIDMFVPNSTPSSGNDIEVVAIDATSSSDDDAASSSDDDAVDATSSSDDEGASSSDEDAASSPAASCAASSSLPVVASASSFAFGADVITSHFVCIKKLQDFNHDGQLDRAMAACGVSADDMAIAINHCPPHHSCAFIKAILLDMTTRRRPSSEVVEYVESDPYERWTDDQRDAIVLSLRRALNAIHACDATFITRRYTNFDRDNYSSCTCAREQLI